MKNRQLTHIRRRIVGTIPLWLSLLLAAPGCTTETGIVVEITQGQLGEAPEALHIVVGVGVEPITFSDVRCADAETSSRYVASDSASDESVDVRERDLTTDPYRLLLRPDEDLLPDQELTVFVTAERAGAIIGSGDLGRPLRFAEDKVLSWELPLQPRQTPIFPEDFCRCIDGGEAGMIVVTPADDRDCDGSVGDLECDDNDPLVGGNQPEICGNGIDENCSGTPDEPTAEVCDGWDNSCEGRCDEGMDPDGDGFTECGSLVDQCSGTDPTLADCAPRNPDVYPGAVERCDGIDTDCNPDTARFPDTAYCYVDAGGCWLGKRHCDDLSEGWQDSCSPISGSDEYLATPELCGLYAQCPPDVDQFQCANQIFQHVSCTLRVSGEADNPALCGLFAEAALPYEGLGENDCRWTMLGRELDAPVRATLISEMGLPDAYVVGDCQAALAIESVEQPGSASLLLWRWRPDGVPLFFRYDIEIIAENNCEMGGFESALTCENVPLPAP